MTGLTALYVNNQHASARESRQHGAMQLEKELATTASARLLLQEPRLKVAMNFLIAKPGLCI